MPNPHPYLWCHLQAISRQISVPYQDFMKSSNARIDDKSVATCFKYNSGHELGPGEGTLYAVCCDSFCAWRGHTVLWPVGFFSGMQLRLKTAVWRSTQQFSSSKHWTSCLQWISYDGVIEHPGSSHRKVVFKRSDGVHHSKTLWVFVLGQAVGVTRSFPHVKWYFQTRWSTPLQGTLSLVLAYRAS